MLFTMTTKIVVLCVILQIICQSAFAQVGDTCVFQSTGALGTCQIAPQCPIAQKLAQNGISPTICGYYQLTIPIVCCERSFTSSQEHKRPQLSGNANPFFNNEPQSQSNSNTFLSKEPSRPGSNSNTFFNNESPQSGSNSNTFLSKEPSRPGSGSNTFFSKEPSRPGANTNTFLNREPSNPDAVVYPDPDESPTISQYVGKSEEKCQEYSKDVTGVIQAIPLVTNTEPVSIDVVKCDYNGVALIVGGKPAAAGEFPFMAAIGFDGEDGGIEWRCGGTLISEEFVLTAAHCTYTPAGEPPKIVRLGDLDLKSTDDNSIYADYNIRKIIVHPDYKYPLKYNDIALLRLNPVVRFTKFIRPACLYTKPQVEVSTAIATGWGKTDYIAAETSDKLMKVALNIYRNERCNQTFGVNKQLPEGIRRTMLCAGQLKGGMDTCQGDSGGPLLITKKGNQCKFYVIGITSFGKYCGQADTPAIYTRVSEFVSWIERTIW